MLISKCLVRFPELDLSFFANFIVLVLPWNARFNLILQSWYSMKIFAQNTLLNFSSTAFSSDSVELRALFFCFVDSEIIAHFS